MAGEGGGKHVCWIQLMAGGGLAPTIGDGCRVERCDRLAGEHGQVVLEGHLVDNHVDQWIEPADVSRRCGRGEHRDHRVESALGVGAIEQCRDHPITPASGARVPVGAELRIAEASEDLVDHRPGDDTALRIDVDTLADDADMGIAAGVGTLVRVVGAIGVGKRHPPADHHRELVEPQIPCLAEQQLCGLGKVVGAARVGERPSEQPKLRHTHRA